MQCYTSEFFFMENFDKFTIELDFLFILFILVKFQDDSHPQNVQISSFLYFKIMYKRLFYGSNNKQHQIHKKFGMRVKNIENM